MFSIFKQPLIIVILTALAGGVWVGLAFPAFVAEHPSLSLSLLIGIFFLSSLSIDMRDVLSAMRDVRTIFFAALFTLILLPLGVYIFIAPFSPALAISFLILAAMPAGMTAPLLSKLAGGEHHIALVFTVATSLLAPLSVPFVISLAAGETVSVNAFAMFTRLAQAIFLPFLAAQLVRAIFGARISRVSRMITPVSTILLGFLILFIVAKRPDEIIALVLKGTALVELGAIFVFFIMLHGIGYVAFMHKKPAEHIAIIVCMAYINFTLAVDLADTFFSTRPDIVLPVVLSVIPWALLFIPFRAIASRLTTSSAPRATS
jgi:BASS family bile acid:Na+ symporter